MLTPLCFPEGGGAKQSNLFTWMALSSRVECDHPKDLRRYQGTLFYNGFSFDMRGVVGDVAAADSLALPEPNNASLKRSLRPSPLSLGATFRLFEAVEACTHALARAWDTKGKVLKSLTYGYEVWLMM